MRTESTIRGVERQSPSVDASDSLAPPADEALAEAEPSLTYGLQRNSICLLASILLHCLAVVFLGLVTWSHGEGQELPGELVEIGELPSEVLDSADDEQLDEAAAEQPSEPLEDAELALPEDPISVDVQLAIDSPRLQSLGGGGEISTAGLGRQSGSGAGGQASFMGVQAYGRRFCIIADRSGSMAGRPLAHVKQEVHKTLETMSNGSSVHIVFYSNHWTAFPGDWGAARTIRDELAEWLGHIKSKGGTNPATSFNHAFELKPPPDAIFFMTDGKIPGNMDKHVASLNSSRNKKIPVHTIAFLNRGAEPLLKRIAEQSGGKFRFVAGF